MKYVILLLCLFGFAACQVFASRSIPVPDRELVFVREEYVDSKWDSYLEQLGFVNADGNGLEIFEAKTVVDKPIWSQDSLFLYGLSKTDWGYPAYWDKVEKRYGLCDENLPYYLQVEGANHAANPYEVILHNAREIILMDLSDCREIKRLVDYEASPAHYNYYIRGISYYPITQELLYGLVIDPDRDIQFHIVRLDLKNGQEEQFTLEGINPSWSPDGTQIAYVSWDGIYVALADGSEPTSLVAKQMFDPYKAGFANWSIPIPRWSPDGEWLAYHICTDDFCYEENSEMYRIRVVGGEPEKILVGGRYPSWRP